MVAKMHSVHFEEALNMTGFGKFNFLVQLVNISLIVGMCFEIMSVAYLVPASACELGTTNFQQGLMAGMPLLGIIATSHFWGYLADTKGRRRILAICMTLAFLFGGSAALSPDWIVFSVLKFLSSCAVAGTYGLSLTLLSECTPTHRRAIMVALTSTIFLSATGLMAVILIPVLQLKFNYFIPYLNIDFTSWRLLTIVFAIPSALGAIGVYLSYESPRFLLTVGKEEEALEILRGIFTINTGKSRDDYNVSSVVLGEDKRKPTNGLWASISSQTVPLLKPPLLKTTLLLSVLFVIVYFGINPFLTWLPYIADSVMKSIEKGNDNITFCDMLRAANTESESENHDCSLNSFAMVAVCLINISIAALNTVLSTIINYVGRKRMLITVQWVSGIGGICVCLTSSWMLSSFFFIIFVSGVLNYGFLFTFSVDVFPTYVKAMAVCITLMVGRGISVFGINILKHMLVHDCELAFYLFGGLTLVGGGISFLLPSDVKVKKDKPIDT